MKKKRKIWKWTKRVLFILGLIVIFEELGNLGVFAWILLWFVRPVWNLFNNRKALKAALDYHASKTDYLKMKYNVRKNEIEQNKE